MLRTSLVARNTLAKRTLTASTRRSASSVSETANEAASKVKDAAESAKNAAASALPINHKASSDVPWMIGSLLVFAPVIFYMTAPPNKDAHHAPAAKEKFKPKLRLPDKDSEFYKIPESVGDHAGEGKPHGEGDHGLRAVAEENDHKVQDQKQGSDKEISANNHDPSSGLKSAGPEKFQAAAKMSQQANQMGGGEAARDTKAVTKAAIEARADKDSGREAKNEDGSAKTGYMSAETPDNAGQKIAEKITDRKAGKSEEDDANDETFHKKDEQT